MDRTANVNAKLVALCSVFNIEGARAPPSAPHTNTVMHYTVFITVMITTCVPSDGSRTS